eukprot:scaffold11206_cov117-Isochrysis_galbana.AAC.23
MSHSRARIFQRSVRPSAGVWQVQPCLQSIDRVGGTGLENAQAASASDLHSHDSPPEARIAHIESITAAPVSVHTVTLHGPYRSCAYRSSSGVISSTRAAPSSILPAAGPAAGGVG